MEDSELKDFGPKDFGPTDSESEGSKLKGAKIKRHLKRYMAIGLVLACVIAVLYGMGLYASSYAKRKAIEVLKDITGKEVYLEELSLTLIPPSGSVKNLVVRENTGGVSSSASPSASSREILRLVSADLYLRALPLLRGRLSIQRAFVDGLTVDTDSVFAKHVAQKLEKLMKKKKPEKQKEAPLVEIKSLRFRNGRFCYKTPTDKIELTLGEIKGSMFDNFLGGVRVNVSDVGFYASGRQKIVQEKIKVGEIDLKAKNISSKDMNYVIENFSFINEGIKIHATGETHGGQSATIDLSADVDVPYLKRVMNLRQNGAGKIHVKGPVTYGKNGVSIDLALNGRIYLETLLELTGDKKTPMHGAIGFRGWAKGPIKDMRAEADATFEKGGFYGVEVDSLTCKVIYGQSGYVKSGGQAGYVKSVSQSISQTVSPYGGQSGNKSGGQRGSQSVNQSVAGQSLMRIVSKDVKLYNGSAKADVTVNLPKVTNFSMDADAQGIDSGPIFELIKFDPGFAPGKVGGKLKSGGRLFSPDVVFTYTSDQARHNDGKDVIKRVRDASGHIFLENDLVTIHEVHLTTGRTEGTAKGVVNIKNDTIDLTGTLRSQDVLDLIKPYSTDATGRANFNFNLKGPVRDLTLETLVDAPGGRFFGISYSDLSTPVTYRADRLIIKGGTARSYGGNVKFAGSIGFPNARHLFDFINPDMAIDVSVRGAEIRDPVAGFLNFREAAGIMDATLNISSGKVTSSKVSGGKAASSQVSGGNIAAGNKNMQLSGKFDVSSLSVYGLRDGHMEGTYNYSGNSGNPFGHRLTLTGLTLKKGLSGVAATLSLDNVGTKLPVTYKIASNKCAIDTRDLPRGDVLEKSSITCSFSGEGKLKEPTLVLFASLASNTGKPSQLDSRVSAHLVGGNVEASGDFLDGRVSLKGSAILNGSFPYGAELVFKDGSYGPILSHFIRNTPQDFRFLLKGKMDVSGDKESFTGRAKIPKASLSAYGHTISNDSPIDLYFHNREMKINSLHLSTAAGVLKASGSVVLGKSYDMIVNGRANLAPLKTVYEKLTWLDGEADVALSLLGNWADPQISGSVSLQGGSLGVKNFRYVLNEINLFAYVENNKAVATDFSATLGGGTITATAVAYMDNFKFKDFHVDGTVNNIPYAINNDLKAVMGGTVVYRGDSSRQSLSGDIKIVSATYTKNFTMQELLFEKSKTQPLQSSPLMKTQLNLHLKGDKNITINNNIAESSVKIDMFIKGTPSNPILYGRVETSNGKVYMRGTDFDLVHASIDFVGKEGFNPYLNVLATTTLKGYDIRLILQGQLKGFNLSMSSTPQLSGQGILSLLTGAAGAGTLLSSKYQNVVEERIKTFGGFSRVQLTPALSDDKSTITPQITLSKKFFQDRLNVTYSSPPSPSKSEIIRMTYKLTNNISLVGERNEIGSIGGDVNFRFHFK
ncbi:MAG: translocation/assembly module TamB domain-containing protein [Nitrospirae bacterium]|nr:translocation/assembly module TamB domain-containing protein [Nitrospirota bacterium]